jgi:hypothetical protein
MANNGIDRTAAVADHNGVRNNPDLAAEIDRHEAGAVPIDIVVTFLTRSKLGQAGSHQKPVPRVIDLCETASARAIAS